MNTSFNTKALRSIEEATTGLARVPPGEPSEKGFRRLGLRVPEVRALVKAGYPFLEGLSNKDRLRTWHHIHKNTTLYEVAHQAIYSYQHRSLSKTEFNTIRQWVDRCDCWEHSDDLSKIYARVFEEHPDRVEPWYRTWNSDSNPWKRRQSVVGLLEYARKRRKVQPFETLISFVVPLLADDAYYVRKGVGWTLREIYNIYPDKTLSFIRENLAAIHPDSYGAATEKLDRALKARLNNERRRLRQLS